MKINQINGAVATLSTQNTAASERADDTPAASSSASARTPESSATWQSTVSQTVSDNSQDIDTARVSQIREAIQNGDFKIDVEKIADGLIDETRRYLDQD